METNAQWHWCSVVNKGELPAPRAGHTVTQFPGRPDCFLLYGGAADGTSFADLHRIEVGRAAAAWDKPCKECDDVCEAATAEWTQEVPAGTPPSPRSGHAAAIFEGRLVVVGGENESGLLADCHVLDTCAMSWSTLGASLPLPLSNHCAVSLPGVISSFCFSEPTLFIFGGRSVSQAQPLPLDQTRTADAPEGAVAECELVGGITLLHREHGGDLVWRTRVAVHDSPDAREMGALAFDDEPAQGRRIFLSGGQLDTKGLVILQDLHVCDISSADIRPRPHIERFEPLTGFTSGGEEMSIHGTGLDGNAAVVSFVTSGYRGQTKNVCARLSGGVLRCVTPEWNQPKDGVEIYVCIDGGPCVRCEATFAYAEPPPPRPMTPPPPTPVPAVVEKTPDPTPDATPAVAEVEAERAASPHPEQPSQAHEASSSPTPPAEQEPAEDKPVVPAPAAVAHEDRGPTWRKEGDGPIPFSYKIRREREDASSRAPGVTLGSKTGARVIGKSTPLVGKASQVPPRVSLAARTLVSAAAAAPRGVSSRQPQPSSMSGAAAAKVQGGLSAAPTSPKKPAAAAGPAALATASSSKTAKGRDGTSTSQGRTHASQVNNWARTAASKATTRVEK